MSDDDMSSKRNNKLEEFLDNLENQETFDHNYQINCSIEEIEQHPFYKMGFTAGLIQERERAKFLIKNLIELYNDPLCE